MISYAAPSLFCLVWVVRVNNAERGRAREPLPVGLFVTPPSKEHPERTSGNNTPKDTPFSKKIPTPRKGCRRFSLSPAKYQVGQQ